MKVTKKRELPDTLGGRLQKLREMKNHTQNELAKIIGVKRESINQWESETRKIKPEYIVKLADYFGVTCDYILRGVKAENVDIHQKTGLSDAAIENIVNIASFNSDFHKESGSISFKRDLSDVLSAFLESKRLYELVRSIKRLVFFYDEKQSIIDNIPEKNIEDIKDSYNYHLWQASKESQKMIEEATLSYWQRSRKGPYQVL